MDKKRRLNFSVSGFKIPFLGGAAVALLEKNAHFDIVTGNSGGAVVAPFYALRKKNDIAEFTKGFDGSMIFGRNPTKFWNIVRAVVLGKPSTGNMDELGELLFSLLGPESDWKERMNAPDVPDTYVGTVNIEDMGYSTWCLNEMELEEAVNAILASAAIPVAFPGQQLSGGGLHYDGGLAFHNMGHFPVGGYNMNQYASMVSIYASTDDYKSKGPLEKKLIPLALRTYEAVMYWHREKDQMLEQLLAEKYGTNLKQYFQTKRRGGMFDDDPEELRAQYEDGYMQIR